MKAETQGVHTQRYERIGLAKIADVPDPVIETVSSRISGYLHLSTKILPSLETPAFAFDPIRQQYDAGAIIRKLESIRFNNVSKVICLTSFDLFVPVFTHVFGEARQGGRAAVVSLFRLHEKGARRSEPSPTLLDRSVKVALHELSHLYNLHHCERKNCLMHFSGLLEDLDQIPAEFCDYCKIFFQTAASKGRPAIKQHP